MNAVSTPSRLNVGTPVGLQGISKRFGDRSILHNIDLHIPSGQFVAVVGRSGCGKAPCYACLPGWSRPAKANCWRVRRRWPARRKRRA